jgi:hypothetical protein
VTPKDKLEGRDTEIFAARDCKLEAAREQRRQRRQAMRKEVKVQTAQTACVLQQAMAN